MAARQGGSLLSWSFGEFDVLERDDWRTRLERGLLKKDQVEEVRRLGYEQLLWLADDVLRRRQDHARGRSWRPGGGASSLRLLAKGRDSSAAHPRLLPPARPVPARPCGRGSWPTPI